VSGDIFVTFAEGISIQPGDQVELSGQLRLPLEFTEDQFPYRDYLKRQGIYAVMYKPSVDVVATGQNFFLFRWLSTLRNNSLEIIRNFMPAREAGLLGGILLGEQRSLDPQLKQNFQITGSSHIIAISGANITIAIGAMMLLFQRLFRKRTALILSLAGVSGYVLLVGASPGVVRAGVMGGFAIVGLLLGREYFSLLGLAGTTFLMTLASPQVFYDIGFQLSCLATLGLILIASPLQKYRWVQKLPPLYGEGVIMGVAAELMTLPLVVFYFKQIALFSLPVGVVGLPALPMIMASGALLVVGGWLFAVWLPLLVNILGWLSWSFVVYLAEVVNFFAAIPFAAISVPQLHPVWLVIYYGLLAFGISYWRAMPDSPYRVNLNRLIRSPAVLPLLLGITGLVWLAIFFG
jgi:competence protein ComEC